MLKVANKFIGKGAPVFVVAEMSANHHQNLDVIIELIKRASDAGADGFKICTLTADTMTIDSDLPEFVINNGSPWDGRRLYDLYQETLFPYEWHAPIFEKCREVGLVCFSTPYDVSAANYLLQFDPPLYKIASFEIFDTPLIKHVASFGKPMVISTGLAGSQDIEAAVQACREVGNNQIILLKCTSAYPAPYKDINLKTLPDMSVKFDTEVGVSDHTLGDEVALASVALGGCFIEKHFTLKRSAGGPDASFSIEPHELEQLVRRVRTTESLLGDVTYELPESASKSLVFARSLFFVKDLKAGDLITAEHIKSIRPGHGLKPSHFDSIVGKRVRVDIRRGTPTSMDLIDE